MKSIVILGSTGSIGSQTLRVIDQNKGFEVLAISANKNVGKFIEQILKYKPKFAVMKDLHLMASVKTKTSHIKTKFISGNDCFEILFSEIQDFDILVSAISGNCGMLPTLKLMEKCKTLAIANKESVVCAGKFLIQKASEFSVEIIPIDSEHNSLYNLTKNIDKIDIKLATITASGGSFFEKSTSELENIKISEALKHPNWSMGAKNTIDSNTMANKALEIMEAAVLFGLSHKEVDAVIQREQIVHALVETKDGAVSAFFSKPNMEIHIINAILNGKQNGKNSCQRLDITKMGKIEFHEIDNNKFPIFYLGKWALKNGFESQIIFNNINEFAVSKFIQEKIKFTDIYGVIYQGLEKDFGMKVNSFEDIMTLGEKIKNYCEDLRL